MIVSFIINCKRCPIPTPVDIHIAAQGQAIDLEFKCRGCGLTETQRVILGPPKPPPAFMGVDPFGRPIEIPTGMQQSNIPSPEPVPEPPKEPPKPEISAQSKFMRNLIEQADLSVAKKHKDKFTDIEYKYIVDSIKEKLKDDKDL